MTKMLRRFSTDSGKILIFASLILTGCAGLTFQVGNPEAAKDESPAAAPPPAVAEKVQSAGSEREEKAVMGALDFIKVREQSYTISPADLLEITVYQEPDMSRKVRVSPEGIITFPLAGSVKVAGLSVPGAEEALTTRLERYLIAPQISVFIKEYGNKQVYILGEVKKPGSYPLPTEAPLSVIEAITLAGGFTQYASIDRTRVIRKSAGQAETFYIDISAIMKRGDKSKDLQLISNDVIFVPESFF